jgi:hypothetical protein
MTHNVSKEDRICRELKDRIIRFMRSFRRCVSKITVRWVQVEVLKTPRLGTSHETHAGMRDGHGARSSRTRPSSPLRPAEAVRAGVRFMG